MKYLVEAAWTGVVEVANDTDFTDAEVHQAACDWLADRVDLKELRRGIRVRGLAHGLEADDRIRAIRREASLVGYEGADEDDA
jgi:hypothetical protein